MIVICGVVNAGVCVCVQVVSTCVGCAAEERKHVLVRLPMYGCQDVWVRRLCVSVCRPCDSLLWECKLGWYASAVCVQYVVVGVHCGD